MHHARRMQTNDAVRHAALIGALAVGCGESAAKPDDSRDAGRDAAIADGDADGSFDDRAYVTIRFEARMGDEPFACGRSYRGVGTSDVEVEPADLRVFVQDVALIRKGDGAEVPLELDVRQGFQRTDVALLDFEDGQGSCASAGGTADTSTVVTGWVPAGDYDGVAFTNGVPEAVNHQNPIDLTAPLVAGPLHWNWNGGFLFFNAQLRALAQDTEPPALDAGADATDAGMGGDGGLPDAPRALGSAVVHIGSTLCSPNRGCGKGNRNRIVLSGFQPSTSRIVLDAAALFADIDLRETTTCHAIGVACGVFFPPLGIDYESGAPAPTQALYRVE